MNQKVSQQEIVLVEAWLRTATADLCDSAKARITAEIKGHYAEAVEAHVHDGLERPQAQVRAHNELGDPKQAAKRFRRKHLTIKEAEFIARVEDYLSKKSPWWLNLAAVPTVFYWSRGRPLTRQMIRRLLLVHAISEMIWFFVLGALFPFFGSRADPASGLFLFFLFIAICLGQWRTIKGAFSCLSISRKLKDDDGFKPLAQ